ncbi:hypothetical protein SDC9_207909 [bioreactor metagenome]|uniref:Uncharacterized protein n=1 Tax=bioreactor metagenome TaxID=1076179 RepID=A0A645JIL8_9ZZZZ
MRIVATMKDHRQQVLHVAGIDYLRQDTVGDAACCLGEETGRRQDARHNVKRNLFAFDEQLQECRLQCLAQVIPPRQDVG